MWSQQSLKRRNLSHSFLAVSFTFSENGPSQYRQFRSDSRMLGR